MPAKFLVVECDDNTAAVEMVKLMLDHGYFHLVLLDDLAKHPSLTLRQKEVTPIPQPANQIESSPASNGTTQNSKKEQHNEKVSLRDILSSRSGQKAQSEKESADVIEMIHKSTPEQITINRFKEELMEEHTQHSAEQHEDDFYGDSMADNEDSAAFPFDFASTSTSHLDLLAQAHCLVDSSSPSSEPNGPPTKKSKGGPADPMKDYHTCQLCGTRVKAPRGGRWNLQMHVMAMHSQARPLQCPECTYTDYRKPGMRKHTVLTHGQDLEPIDISTDEKRTEWDAAMSKCFPEFAYRTGFLTDSSKQNPELPNYCLKKKCDN